LRCRIPACFRPWWCRWCRSARSPASSIHAGKVADFFEQEVDDAVEGLSQPAGAHHHGLPRHLIGGLVVAMYLPIFKLGSVV
jgi:hypothetical protein